ncbi:hypothetical protein HPB50_028047 [Hyalomma asiaticum]|nr:hypothetical protein HPB50_028047 [Hyalomma asiaticum]
MDYPETQATGVIAQETTPNEELPSPKIWDHVGKIHKDRTDECRRWVGCDIKEANYNRILGDLVYAQQNNTAKIHTHTLGRPGTPYDGSDHTRGTGPKQQVPLPSLWSLVSSEREAPTVKCRRRVGCGIHKAEFYRFSGVLILAEYNTAEIHALLLGPPGTPDQGNANARKTAPKHWLPAPLFWYLVSSEHEGPTDEFRCRFGCCCNREALLYRVHRASFSAEKNNTAKTNGLVIRPAGTPYEAGYSARGNTPKKQLLSASFWYHVSYEREESTKEHRRRVGCGIPKAKFYRVARVLVAAEENDTAKIPALIVGPPGTPYEGGFFQFLTKCPPDYRDSSPRVRLMITDAGRVRFGLRFYENVMACLGRLGSLYEETWISYRYLLNVVFLIKFLLTPEIAVSQGSDFAALLALGTPLSDKTRYNAVQPHKTTFVAVCDAVEQSPRPTTACPRYHRDEIVKYFPVFYAEYWRAAPASSRGTTSNQEPPPPNFLGLVSCDLEELADECRRRVGCGSTELEYYRVPGELVRAKENTTKIRALILGPPFAPHEGSASMQCPPTIASAESGAASRRWSSIALRECSSDPMRTTPRRFMHSSWDLRARRTKAAPARQAPCPTAASSSELLVPRPRAEDEGPADECRRGSGAPSK